jgi:lipopolysaccharide biosynthesis glycosyltransferase
MTSDFQPVDTVRAATATNRRYLPFIAVLASSLGSSQAASASTLTVLHAGDVTADDQRRLARSAPGVELEWRLVAARDYARHGLAFEGLLAEPAYFRCLLPDLLPAELERVIYIDADTMVCGDLGDLYRHDLGGAPVGAVLDWVPTVREAITPWRELGLDGSAPYFNSGVLLVDLPQWRDAGAGPQALARCLADQRYLAAQGRWMQHDQYGLNVVFHKRWSPLPNTWNYYADLPDPGQVGPVPRIVHLVGNGKPWSPNCRPQFAADFYAAVDRTEWAGWRGPDGSGGRTGPGLGSGPAL